MNARRSAYLLLVIGIGLLPWAVGLGLILPERQVAAHWDLAWSGFDVALGLTMIATGVGLLRRWPSRGMLATATGVLLFADAWFDVVTAATANERWFAVVLAVLVELPLATFCFVLARFDPPS